MAGPFQKRDILIALLGIIGLVIFLVFYEKAFPTASLNLQVSRSQALQIAREFLETQKFNLQGYDETVIFSEDDLGLIYLQQTFGMDRFNQLVQPLPLRYWTARFFRELEHEEFTVNISPQGQILAFIHYIPEDAQGAHLKQGQALTLAQGFLKQQQSIKLAQYKLINRATGKREKRTDHSFTWEASAQDFGEARLRFEVAIHGNVVDSYRQYLKVPEKFWETYQGEQSKGDLLASISTVFSILLALLSMIIVLMAYKKGDIPWKGALILVVIMVSASLLEAGNAIPVMKSYYATESPLYTFWGEMILDSIRSSLFLAVMTFVVVIAGWVVCRETFTEKRKDDLTTGQDWFSWDFAHASFIGYLLSFISLGYVTAFYLVGKKYLGIWSPVDSPYTNMLGTWLPFLDPLTGAFQAAVSEELVFRYFEIALLLRYLKVPALALLIPAMIWGFGHSNYEVSPVYIRGIELTLAGLIMGYFFLRYGLITVIMAHFTLDAILMGMPLIQSSNSYFFWSGMAVIGVMAIPMVLGFVNLIKKLQTRIVGYKENMTVRGG